MRLLRTQIAALKLGLELMFTSWAQRVEDRYRLAAVSVAVSTFLLPVILPKAPSHLRGVGCSAGRVVSLV